MVKIMHLILIAKCHGDLSSPLLVCLFLPPLSVLATSFPPVDRFTGLFSSLQHLCVSYPLHVPLVHLAVESLFCQALGCFLDHLHWCEYYLVVSMGQSELSAFHLCHLPIYIKFNMHIIILYIVYMYKYININVEFGI